MMLDEVLHCSETPVVISFRQLYSAAKYDRAARLIISSPTLCLDLASSDFFHFLTTNGRDEILSAMVYALDQNEYCFIPLLDSRDFLKACSSLSAPLIALYAMCPNTELLPMINTGNSPLQIIMERDDPDLLLGCLELVPELLEIEKDKTYPIQVLLQAPKRYPTLIEQLWILAKKFQLTHSQLDDLALYWLSVNPDMPLPKILDMVYQMSVETRTTRIIKERINNDREKALIGATFVTIPECKGAKTNMSAATDFLRWMKNEMDRINKEELSLSLDLAVHTPTILVQVPMYLLSHKKMMIYRNLSFEKPLIQEEAVGTGPVQDMFNFYFQQISNSKYFESGENSTLSLPVSRCDPEELHGTRTVLYGLGVVFLKILHDRRNFGANQDTQQKQAEVQRIKPMHFDLHPWVFRALLWKMKDDYHTLIHECLLYNNNFGKMLLNTEKTFTKDTYIEKAIDSVMFAGTRRILFEDLRDGFNLKYVDGLTPVSVRSNMEDIRTKLSSFYDEIHKLSPSALQFMIVGTPTINADVLINRFDFRLHEDFAVSTDEQDVIIDEDCPGWSKYERRFKRSVECFKAGIRTWCAEPGQEKIRGFLNFLLGTPTMSPMQSSKWVVGFVLNFDSGLLRVFACDRTIRSKLYDSADEFLRIAQASMEMHRLDPTIRDTEDISYG